MKRICVNCKHHAGTGWGYDGFSGYTLTMHRCTRDRRQAIDPVTGASGWKGTVTACVAERTNTDSACCGPIGKHYEEDLERYDGYGH
jgi:hypothetical protein